MPSIREGRTNRQDPRARRPACRGRSIMRAGCTTWTRRNLAWRRSTGVVRGGLIFCFRAGPRWL